MVSEMQARLIANVFSDKINLPVGMGEIYTKDVSNNKEYFKICPKKFFQAQTERNGFVLRYISAYKAGISQNNAGMP